MAGTVASIEFVSAGLQTTIQDLGRFGFGHYGIPPSGALDSFALRIANLLVGNPEGHAGLETTLMGLRFKARADVLIAVTGADLQPQIECRSIVSVAEPRLDAAIAQQGRRNGGKHAGHFAVALRRR